MVDAAINTAVFPVAGLGTRFLPITKAAPKEMLTIVDKPIIQYVVEEAVDCGIKRLIFVTSSNKRAIEDYFDTHYEMEALLRERGREDLLQQIRDIVPSDVSIAYVRQSSPKGLGDAIYCARAVVGDQPFAVLLPDDLIEGGGPCGLGELLKIYAKTGHSVIGVEAIPPAQSKNYGVVDVGEADTLPVAIRGIVEKPSSELAPSKWGVVGRYVFTPQIFNHLEKLQAGVGGEVQITDAIAQLLKHQPIYVQAFSGDRYDCGTKLGYLKACVQYALKHPEIGEEFAQHLLDRNQ